jgi:hypothetical protein
MPCSTKSMRDNLLRAVKKSLLDLHITDTSSRFKVTKIMLKQIIIHMWLYVILLKVTIFWGLHKLKAICIWWVSRKIKVFTNWELSLISMRIFKTLSDSFVEVFKSVTSKGVLRIKITFILLFRKVILVTIFLFCWEHRTMVEGLRQTEVTWQ